MAHLLTWGFTLMGYGLSTSAFMSLWYKGPLDAGTFGGLSTLILLIGVGLFITGLVMKMGGHETWEGFRNRNAPPGTPRVTPTPQTPPVSPTPPEEKKGEEPSPETPPGLQEAQEKLRKAAEKAPEKEKPEEVKPAPKKQKEEKPEENQLKKLRKLLEENKLEGQDDAEGELFWWDKVAIGKITNLISAAEQLKTLDQYPPLQESGGWLDQKTKHIADFWKELKENRGSPGALKKIRDDIREIFKKDDGTLHENHIYASAEHVNGTVDHIISQIDHTLEGKTNPESSAEGPTQAEKEQEDLESELG